MTPAAEYALASPTQVGDAQLLASFANHHSQDAFAEIVRRHGPMVLAVCRSVLGETSSAEDAAQAVFLTLARTASSLHSHKTIVGWLHRVAWYVSARAAEAAAIRRRHEQEAARMRPETSAESADLSSEQIHAAIRQLPEKCRAALLLHYFEGHTESETAAILCCSPSAASMRLSRGRQMLRDRLVKRGVSVSAEVLTGVMSRSASAVPPSTFVHSVVGLATSSLAGGPITSTAIATLSKGAMKMLWITKLKLAAALVFTMILLTTAGVYVASSLAATQPATAPATNPAVAGPLSIQSLNQRFAADVDSKTPPLLTLEFTGTPGAAFKGTVTLETGQTLTVEDTLPQTLMAHG
ncbi:MAG TPA: sigma-70 family RNA polymerase sigma factor, partial [Tepidisphaeraceae bacterium]|nr:sigma-70 family RNA polymerase sigma factor [Tepidisphaeraceae bacterium]